MVGLLLFFSRLSPMPDILPRLCSFQFRLDFLPHLGSVQTNCIFPPETYLENDDDALFHPFLA